MNWEYVITVGKMDPDDGISTIEAVEAVAGAYLEGAIGTHRGGDSYGDDHGPGDCIIRGVAARDEATAIKLARQIADFLTSWSVPVVSVECTNDWMKKQWAEGRRIEALIVQAA